MEQFSPTDDMLEEFVNGSLDEADCLALKVYLRQFPLLAASLERERHLMRGLKAAGDAIAAEPVPERLTRIIEDARAVRHRRRA